MAPETAFPIVGIGASAGGITALKNLFAKVPPSPGLAFVVVQHLSPDSKSLASEIFARSTPLPVTQITNGMKIEKNHVYVIPPSVYLTIQDYTLHLSEVTLHHGLRMPIDTFFWSLAQQHEERAIAIILSGTGHDGTSGAQAISGHGGLVMAQSPESADFDGMPQSAIETGAVDVVCTVEEMPGRILDYLANPAVSKTAPSDAAGAEAEEHNAEGSQTASPAKLDGILSLLKMRTGYDFTGYKRGTLDRRIARRMGLARLDSISAYTEFLKKHPDELNALQKDLLIRVTTFFRDMDAFKALVDTAIAPIVESKSSTDAIRVWVPGCASGEEAFSIAMLLMEQLEAAKKHCTLQIFATDLDEAALAVARNAVFPENALANLSPVQLKRFFTREDHHYRATKTLRDCITFAKQNLLGDPPFSRIDLISCRNLLIYLKPEMQRQVLGLFHFALNPEGFLFLGNAETVNQRDTPFEPVDKKMRIFRRQELAKPTLMDFPTGGGGSIKMDSTRTPGSAALDQPRLQQSIQRKLLQDYAPAAILTNDKHRILYFFGQTSPYLEQPPGAPTDDLINLARAELRPQLRQTLQKAFKEKRQASSDPVSIRHGGSPMPVKIVVKPHTEPQLSEPLLLVTFEDLSDAAVAADAKRPADSKITDDTIVPQLERELEATRAELNSCLEEQESIKEEMQAANEEVISVNEELQSSNEELESSKEELQSMNEELTTLNSQLSIKVEELAHSNEDLDNLLSSTDIATLFLDDNMCIGRFTPATKQLFNLIAGDIGRPCNDIRQKYRGGNLLADVERVLQNLVLVEQEVQSEAGRWYLQRILPYRTSDKRIVGVVITFIDITTRKEAEQQAQLFSAVVRDSNDAIIVLDANGHITAWNRGAQQMYGWSETEALAMTLYELVPEEERDNTRALLRRIVAREPIPATEDVRVTKNGTRMDIWLTLTPLTDTEGRVHRIATTERDITAHKRTESVLRAAKVQAEEVAATKARFLATASHDLRQPLQSISAITSALLKTVDDPKTLHMLELQNSSLEDIRRLLNSLLDVVKLDSGGVEPVIENISVLPMLTRLGDEFAEQARGKGLKLLIDATADQVVSADIGLLAQLLRNLIANAIRYTRKGQIQLACETDNGHLRISVSDTGIGISSAELSAIFNEFHQVNPSLNVRRRGMGLGLSIVQRIARVMNTRIDVESEVGHGSTFSFTLPVGDTNSAAGTTSSQPNLEFNGGDASILLLEDDPSVRDSMQQFLSIEGFEVMSGATPQEADAALEYSVPDIIVTDYHLGGRTSALDIVRKVRARVGHNIPAIIFTGDTSISLGGLEFAELKIKPVDSQELLAAIHRLLHGSQERQ